MLGGFIGGADRGFFYAANGGHGRGHRAPDVALVS